MSKRELIDRIRRLNPTAQPDFLATFTEQELLAYLRELSDLQSDRRRRSKLEPAMVG